MPRHSNETEVAEFKQKNWSSKRMNDTNKGLIGSQPDVLGRIRDSISRCALRIQQNRVT
jgi:hypothetical protein